MQGYNSNGYPPQGYPQIQLQGGNMGYPQQMRRMPKYQVYDMITAYVQQQTGVAVTKLQKITETPEVFRHSCVQTGITTVQRCIYTVQSMGMPVTIPFYFCPSCGKLYVFSDFET